jgi:hypothetical protein
VGYGAEGIDEVSTEYGVLYPCALYLSCTSVLCGEPRRICGPRMTADPDFAASIWLGVKGYSVIEKDSIARTGCIYRQLNVADRILCSGDYTGSLELLRTK